MRLLLDTHIALWAIVDSPQLSVTARELISDRRNVVFVSAVSVWEIAIKHALGREAGMPLSAREALVCFRSAGYKLLDVSAEHAAGVEQLPLHHADPFDRFLVAQALVEPLRLLTRDATVLAYSDTIIEV